MKRSARIVVFRLAAAGLFLAAYPCAALSTEERIDVSRVVDKAAAEAVLGEAVKNPAPRNMHGVDGYYSKCNYYSASSGKALVLRVYQAAPGFNAEKELEAVKASTGPSKVVSGLGDKAQVHSGAESGLPGNVLMLYVIKGNSLITVGVAGLDQDVALEKTKSVAQRILAKL